jgi:hypothetical protein
MADDTDIYLIWSHEHRGWWAPDGNGYTHHLSQAGRYTKQDAMRICTDAIRGASGLRALPELPVRLEDVEAMVRTHKAMYDIGPEPWE